MLSTQKRVSESKVHIMLVGREAIDVTFYRDLLCGYAISKY